MLYINNYRIAKINTISLRLVYANIILDLRNSTKYVYLGMKDDLLCIIASIELLFMVSGW